MGFFDFLGSLVGLGGTAMTNKSNEKLNREQMKFNADQAQLSRDWQEEMWNKSNAYSSPIQQMQRLSDAGLNPNLVYGNGADTTAASVPSTSSASAGSLKAMQDPRLGELFTQAMSIQNMRQQNENLKAQNEVLREDARGKRIANDISEETQEAQIQIKNLEKRKSVHENAILASKSYQETINSEIREKELQKVQIDLDYFEANKEVDLKRAVQDLENANKIAKKQVELMTSEVAKNFNASLAYQADIALKKFELSKQKKMFNKEMELLVGQIRKVKEDCYNAMESGRTEVYKQGLLSAQSHLAEVMASKAYQDMDAQQQKMIVDLWKSSFQIVSGK